MPSRNIRLMVIATHPADSFDQAGGTLSHHVDQGDKVAVVIVTTGVRSHHWRLADQRRGTENPADIESEINQAAEEKLNEARQACRILGFDDLRNLGFEDDDILVSQDKIDAIAEQIRDFRPDVLISHHPFETGGLKMHATIGQSTIFALQVAAGSGRGTQRPHNVPAVYFMNPQAYVGNNSLEYGGTDRADLYVDITDVIDRKVLALDQIKSQRYDGAYARKRSEADDGSWGQKAGVAYAELFQRYQPLVLYTLPVTDAELDLVDSASVNMMARRGEVVGGLMPLENNTSYTAEHRVPKNRYRI